jgi:hypothetical protein
LGEHGRTRHLRDDGRCGGRGGRRRRCCLLQHRRQELILLHGAELGLHRIGARDDKRLLGRNGLRA